ncbi:uncharacterized protein LOC111320757 isoform X2 [Stylophora pistillata]|uniref:uncharacterized protein LOC111320757 isoform X2 n=1 Tax=Stylophora pistillata TaxID=50429 RepID=UPI000C0497A2|nr:uncharacterized protein LOC111320757 isoform X2 [Stylophora pistillata]
MAVQQLTHLFLMTFYTLLEILAVPEKAANFCGNVFENTVDRVLLGHVMDSVLALNEFECQLKCIDRKGCKSVNVRPNRNKKNLCELNSQNRQTRPQDFREEKGSTYYGSLQVSCVDISSDKKRQTKSGQCHPGYHGERCQTGPKIRNEGHLKTDGEYWIDLEKNGNALKVFCDMNTDGGGWLLVSSIVIDNAAPNQMKVETSYRGINSSQMVLSKAAMNELRSHLGFTQIRFHCSKHLGRIFHVTTAANSTGEAVVQYFSGQTDVQPDACGSFVRMKNDNSNMSRQCHLWGLENGAYRVGKWGHSQDQDRLYNYPAFVYPDKQWFTRLDGYRFCDDAVGSNKTAGDFWKIYVR